MTKQQNTHFSYRSDLPVDPSTAYQWHDRPGALIRLLPPWQDTELIERSGGLGKGGRTKLIMHVGPLKIGIEAHHLEAEENHFFIDQQIQGPFAYWQHKHNFISSPTGSVLQDDVEYRVRGSAYLPDFIKKHVHKELYKTFIYREKILQHDLRRHQLYSTQPLRILISGASGAIGRELCPFLTSGGHTVIRLVRRPPKGDDEVFWDPSSGVIDELPEIDAVIHLAGEYIGLSRWSKKKKEAVLASRVKGTKLLVDALKKHPPKVFLSSSAIGYYGDNPQQNLQENAKMGDGFLPQVCDAWEREALEAQKLGIRTVTMRIGVVLGRRSGALKRMLLAAKCGFPKAFGDGTQYTSWVGLQDTLAAILHCLVTPTIAGPVNIASPIPITNRDFFSKLAYFTKKPLLPSIPATYLKILYGEMANEIALASCSVTPHKLTESGFVFSEPDIDITLRNQLGSTIKDAQ